MPEQLIEALYEVERTYLSLKTEEDRKSYFMSVREHYNEKKLKRYREYNAILFSQ